jgi:DNA transformation protein and related proteins
MTRAIGKSNRSPNQPKTMEKIRNVGPKSAAWLKQVGVKSTADVRAIGAFNTFLKVRKAGFKASLNLIYALAGAELDCDWRELAPERKQELAKAFEAFEAEAKAQRKIFSPRSGPGSGAVSAILEQALGKSEAESDSEH